MNQIKIGKFIACCRKEQGMTQAILAERLGISNRAVSKWETGKSMPDSGLMLDLCKYLNINVNELLSGEHIMDTTYNKHAEQNLIQLKKENEEQAKFLLNIEWGIGYLSSITFIILIFTASFLEMVTFIRILLIVLAVVLLVCGVGMCLFIEQRAGYYECSYCGYRYLPSYKQVLFSMHKGRTRYMKCPHCGKRNWQKKVLSND